MVYDECGVNNLVKLYYGCPLFKKYCHCTLWRKNSYEYDNLEYCRRYVHKRARFLILKQLLQSFSLTFVLLLYSNPTFIKFIRSGFFHYLKTHFLLLFYNNLSFCAVGNKVFIKNYFDEYIKFSIQSDLLFSVRKCLIYQCLKTFIGALMNRINNLDIEVFKFESINKFLLEKASKVLENIYNPISFFRRNKLYGAFKKVYSRQCLKFFLNNSLLGIKKDIGLDKKNNSLLFFNYIIDGLSTKFIVIGFHKDINVVFKDLLRVKSSSCKKCFKKFNNLKKSFRNTFLCAYIKLK